MDDKQEIDINIQRDKIAKFAFDLNTQNCLPLWSITHEELIYSAAVNKSHLWTKKKKKLLFLIRLARAFGDTAVDTIVFLFGFFVAVRVWLLFKRKTYGLQKKPQDFSSVFAGFGPSSEDVLFNEYKKKTVEKFLRINWVTHEGEEKIGCPAFFSMTSTLAKNAFGYSKKLNTLESIKNYQLDFLVVCATNIGRYAFYSEFWRMAKLQGIQEATFLAPDIPLFACVDAGIKTVYIQHGLLAFMILIPNLSRIETATEYEKKYLMKFCPNTKIVRKLQKKTFIRVKKNTVLILSPDVHLHESKGILGDFIKWMRQMELQIIIRPRPGATENTLSVLRNYYPCAIIDNAQRPLEDSFIDICPKLVVSGSSTGLATALDYGLLPVSLCDSEKGGVFWPSTPHEWSSMIYPMSKKVLFWPRDQAMISKAIYSDTIYDKQLLLLDRAANFDYPL